MVEQIIALLPDLTKFLMSTMGFIPIPDLYLIYRRTGVVDYLIFAGVFFFFSSSVIFSIFALQPPSVFFWQLRHISMYSCYILVFLHARRLTWFNHQKFLTVGMMVWFFALIALTLLWESMPNERGVFLFWEMDPHSMDAIFSLDVGQNLPETGAGLVINGAIILSTSHPILAYSFYFFVACYFLYIYFTIKPASPTPRILVAKRLWLVIGLANFSATGLLLFWPVPNTYELVIFFVLLELVLIATVAIKYPESMLITQVQLYRAIGLYKEIQKMEQRDFRKITEIRMEKIVQYLKMIKMETIEGEASEGR
ncbi:MAG: hypothetical protein ACW98F_05540 [Candidatus Hodarchaeales archaeon]|jgi:hypothetical protein